MMNWNINTIANEHNYSVEYIYVPFKDALFREKSIQTHRQFDRLSLGKAKQSLAFYLKQRSIDNVCCLGPTRNAAVVTTLQVPR